MNTTYIIIPLNEITDSMIINSLNETNSFRLSVAGDLAILKFNTSFPDIMKGYCKYSHTQILEILAGETWTPGL